MSFGALTSLDSSDIANSSIASKQSAGINFKQVRNINYQVMRGTMETDEIQVLIGKANYDAARDCLSYDLDIMTRHYSEAWAKCSVVLPVI